MLNLKFRLVCSALAVMSATAVSTAQNPVIRDQFSADPTARVFNNKMYIGFTE